MHKSEDPIPQAPRWRDHLARTLGQAFHAAYRGDLEQVYSEQENLIRVTWSR